MIFVVVNSIKEWETESMTTREYLFYSGNNASLNTVTKQDGLVWYSEHFLESGRPLSDFLELANVYGCQFGWNEGDVGQSRTPLYVASRLYS